MKKPKFPESMDSIPGGAEFLDVLNRVIRYKPKNWKKRVEQKDAKEKDKV